MLYAYGGPGNTHVLETFATHGIPRDRIELLGGNYSRDQFVRCYNQIDIAFDPLPCAGGITTMDALWMGVPVVTLPGPTSVSRAGKCILGHLDLNEYVAASPNEYVQIATRLATDPDALNRLRHELPARLRQSKLMDSAKLTSSIEAAFERAWERFMAKT